MPQKSGLRWGHLEQPCERGWPFERLLFLQPCQNGGPGQQGWIIQCFLHPQGTWSLHRVGLHQRAARAGEEGPMLAVSSGALIGLSRDQLRRG